MVKSKVMKRKASAVGKKNGAAGRFTALARGEKYMTGAYNGPSVPVTPLNQFKCAVDDPFCAAACGAKIPDAYSANTEPMTLRARFQWAADGSTTMVLTPNPLVAGIAYTLGNSTALAGIQSLGTGLAVPLAINTNAGGTTNVVVLAASNAQTFGDQVVSYRTVGWGVRVKNITQVNVVTGDLIVAKFPCNQYLPAQVCSLVDRYPAGSPTLFAARPQFTNWYDLVDAFSLPAYTYAPATANGNSGLPILGLEGSAEAEVFTNAEVAQSGGILVKPKFHSEHFMNIHSAVTQVNEGPHAFNQSGSAGGAATGLALYNAEATNIQGHNCVVVQPSSVAANQVYEIEVIYHLEAVRKAYASTRGTVVGVGATPSPSVPKRMLEAAIESLKDSPWVEFIKHEGSRIYGAMNQALPALMTKAAMAALTAI